MSDMDSKGCVLCLGYFDGVHRGHQSLIMTAANIASETGLSVSVHTFDKCPSSFITGKPILTLTLRDEREFWLRYFGTQNIYTSSFEEGLMNMPGIQFLERILRPWTNFKYLVAGTDHRFGKSADTGASELKAYCSSEGIGCKLIEPVCSADGQKISSTRIRDCITMGRNDEAFEMLGHSIKLLSDENVQ